MTRLHPCCPGGRLRCTPDSHVLPLFWRWQRTGAPVHMFRRACSSAICGTQRCHPRLPAPAPLRSKWLLALQERRKYERRNEVIQARLTLEQQFASPPEDGDEQQGGDDSTRRPRRPGGGGTPGSDRV